jgi:methylmalonyl-CoA mutase N-terminal domain/subunit
MEDRDRRDRCGALTDQAENISEVPCGLRIETVGPYDCRMADDSRRTDSGIEIDALYTADNLGDWNPADRLGLPGEAPYTRGIYSSMYRGRMWTMRQYSGFGDAAATNERFHFLLNAGQTGLSCAFDLPTQMGYDSDHPRAEGEVGKVGVAIDSLDDMRALLKDVPLDTATTSMTINSTAAILLLMYELVAEEQGIDPAKISGTIQNDLLKEYIARGTYIYPPRPSMRIITDIFGYCAERIPRWNTISISGYHIREAGSTAAQEIAFTLSNAIAYVQAAVDAGLEVDDFAPRLSFFFNGHNHFFEEVAKFRASRRMWHSIMTDRFGAKDPKSAMLRFHTQTGGSTLTAQQPDNNVVRVAIQALAAVMGGTQSLHTNGFDEALSLPTENAARLALRTQQVIAHESGVTDTPDPLAGSYLVESLTDEVEKVAWEYINRIEEMGGAVAAIERGYQMDEIDQAAYEYTKSIDDDERVIVGLNKYELDDEPEPRLFPIDPAVEGAQKKRLAAFKADRDIAEVETRLEAVRDAARGDDNVLYPIKEALRVNATLGEISDALRDVFGIYHP